MVNRAAAALLLAIAAAPAAASDISGIARVIDGDTLAIGDQHIRLDGIDAPETHQICLDAGGRRWTCGIAARDGLAALIGGRSVSCMPRGRDRYGRTLAECSAGGVDLNEAMARRGWALAYLRYSHRYAADEADAREHQRGLWAGAFIAPWDWRHRNKSTVILGAISVPIDAQAALLAPAPSAGRRPARQ